MSLQTWASIALISIGFTISAPAFANQQENPEAQRLTQRLNALNQNPEHANLATLERMQAQQAIDAVSYARRNEIATALQIADWRIDTVEHTIQAELLQLQIQALDSERRELLLEASHREAARARQEAERLRIQAQIQAEEAERLRQAMEAEAQARQEAEGVLDTVANDQIERARAARQRAAQLKAQEDALRRKLEEDNPH